MQTGIGGVNSLNMSFAGNGRTYRYMKSQADDAIFSFGWGLSFSQFSFSHLVTSKTSVSAVVKNTGRVAGAEIAQLYLGIDGVGSALPPVKYALATLSSRDC